MEGTQIDRNKAFIEKVDMAFAAGDTGFLISHMHDDVVWRMVGESTFKGKKEVQKMVEKMAEMDLPEIVRTRITAEGNRVVAEGTLNTTTTEGKPFKAAYCDSYLIEDDKIKEMTSYVVEQKKHGN